MAAKLKPVPQSATFQFPANKLRAVSIFAAVNDIRYYLNGVYFAKAPNGKGMMAVATDGHRLTAVYHEQDVSGIPDGFEVIVPAAELTRAAKVPAKPQAGVTLDVVLTIGAAVEGVRPVVMKSSITVECREVGGKYPDWQKVIPRGPFAPSAVCVDGNYIADYAKLHRVMGKRYSLVSLYTNGKNSSVRIDVGDDDFVCVLMPMRGGDLCASAWMDASPVKKADTVPAAAGDIVEGRS